MIQCIRGGLILSNVAHVNEIAFTLVITNAISLACFLTQASCINNKQEKEDDVVGYGIRKE